MVREGRVAFEGQEIGDLSPPAMREIWGTEMAMIFQDPMTSLNPVMKIGRQITESLKLPPRTCRRATRAQTGSVAC